MGDKVFLGARHKNSKIIAEVTKAIKFLECVARRNVGEEVPMDFYGDYCSFAVRIVGKKAKMTPSGEVYIKHIKKNLVPKGTDTLYLLGTWDNKDIIDNICAGVEDTFEKHRDHKSKVVLTYKAGEEQRPEQREQYLVILRKKELGIFRRAS